jgi:hypothetical protein
MRVVEDLGDVAHERGGFAHREHRGAEVRGERCAFDELRRDPRTAITEQTAFVDPRDAGMVERFDDAGFAQ